jgi:heme-degrading monooxygenase HmoA
MAEMPWKSLVEPDPEREYLALLTFLPVGPLRTMPAFMRSTQAVRGQLEGAEGLVGYSLRAKPLSRQFWTLSVCEDEEHLQRFVRQSPHREVMASLARTLGGFRTTRFSLQGSAVPPAWDDALARG